MEIFYGVGTNAEYSLTANNYDGASFSSQQDFTTNYPYSCLLAYSLAYYDTVNAVWDTDLTSKGINHVQLVANDDTDIRL